MKLLYAFPFVLIAWTMFIFAYVSKKNQIYVDTLLYAIFSILFLYLAIKRCRNYKIDKPDIANTIAINIGLFPLLYSNIVLTPIILQGKGIHESGMVYVLVLIYSPVMYIGALIIIQLYKSLFRK